MHIRNKTKGIRMDSQTRGPGQPPVKIDWAIVEMLLVKGCTGREITGRLGLGRHTLFDAVQREKKMLFSEYAEQFYAKGNTLLREVQFDKALSGDNAMLIWLGKNRMKQNENNNPQGSTGYKVKVSDGLGSGIEISASRISDSGDQSSEFGEEESDPGMAQAVR